MLLPHDTITGQILSLEMHRGLRPLGATPLTDISSTGARGDGTEQQQEVPDGVEGSRAAAKAVEAFVRNNIEAYFGLWASTYSVFSLNPRLVCFCGCVRRDVWLCSGFMYAMCVMLVPCYNLARRFCMSCSG